MDVDIKEFDKTQEQLKAFHEEIGHLSRKKPDDAINKFKIRLINKVLAKANSLLEPQYAPFEDYNDPQK